MKHVVISVKESEKQQEWECLADSDALDTSETSCSCDMQFPGTALLTFRYPEVRGRATDLEEPFNQGGRGGSVDKCAILPPSRGNSEVPRLSPGAHISHHINEAPLIGSFLPVSPSQPSLLLPRNTSQTPLCQSPPLWCCSWRNPK